MDLLRGRSVTVAGLNPLTVTDDATGAPVPDVIPVGMVPAVGTSGLLVIVDGRPWLWPAGSGEVGMTAAMRDRLDVLREDVAEVGLAAQRDFSGLLAATVESLTATIAALEERITVLEPPVPVNLIANPGPAIDQLLGDDLYAQWAASGWWSDADDPWVYGYDSGGYIYSAGPLAPYTSAEIYTLAADFVTQVSPYAPTLGPAVTAGGSYDASVYVTAAHGVRNGTEVRIGIVWYDASDAEISTSWGTAGAVVASTDYVWHEGTDATAWSETFWPSARPTVTATAPTGAVKGRPVLEVNQTNHAYVSENYMVALFEMYGPL